VQSVSPEDTVYTLSQLRESDLMLPIGFAVIVGGYLINLTYVLIKVLF
jgi:hypothetical protein